MRKEHGKLIIGLALAGITVLFTLQNIETVEVRFLIWTLSTSRALMIFTVLAVGIIVGWFLHSWKRRNTT